MNRPKQCLNCANWQPEQHQDWKPRIYAPFEKYNLWDLRQYLGDGVKWKGGWPGKCHLQPAPVPTRSTALCGQWVVNDLFLQSWEGITENARALEEIDRLRAELKAAKELAAARYRRLYPPKLKPAEAQVPTNGAAP